MKFKGRICQDISGLVSTCQNEVNGQSTHQMIFNQQGPDFDDMLSFFPCEVDDAIQYINLGYGMQAPKLVIL